MGEDFVDDDIERASVLHVIEYIYAGNVKNFIEGARIGHANATSIGRKDLMTLYDGHIKIGIALLKEKKRKYLETLKKKKHERFTG